MNYLHLITRAYTNTKEWQALAGPVGHTCSGIYIEYTPKTQRTQEVFRDLDNLIKQKKAYQKINKNINSSARDLKS